MFKGFYVNIESTILRAKALKCFVKIYFYYTPKLFEISFLKVLTYFLSTLINLKK